MDTNLPAGPVVGKRALLACLAASWLATPGCGKAPEGFERYVPAPAPARAAVVAVLDAWRAGRPVGEGVGPGGDVHVVDKQRKAGQALVSYEVIGEVAAERGRGYAVRLVLDPPEERPLVRFLVLGTKPIWVFRQEDFEMFSHWMHPMEAPDATAPERPAEP